MEMAAKVTERKEIHDAVVPVDALSEALLRVRVLVHHPIPAPQTRFESSFDWRQQRRTLQRGCGRVPVENRGVELLRPFFRKLRVRLLVIHILPASTPPSAFSLRNHHGTVHTTAFSKAFPIIPNTEPLFFV